ncbi:hypothetical protein DIPPA_23865 [Diplonema papillatum]|nr:hypothetical protein DIPPA_23865 [Diplonema papillatum]
MILWVVLHCVSAIPLQPLRIDARRVVVSHAADFSHQFHVAFSGTVTGAYIFSGQPYTCAVTRFAHDALVRQTQM